MSTASTALLLKSSSPARLILVRHAVVAERYRGICYGRSDVELGPEGEQQSCQVADTLARELGDEQCDHIAHSGLQRARFLAERLGERLDCPLRECTELRERDFGTWELQTWDTLHARHADEMLRMISDPDSYRPGGGETTFALRDRILRWFESLSLRGTVIAVTHGGPIAALLGTQRQVPVLQWPTLIPGCGEHVAVVPPPKQQG